MTRPVHLRGKRARIAAALVTGVVAASVFVIASSSTPSAGAQATKATSARTVAAAPATAAAKAKLTTKPAAKPTIKATTKTAPAKDVPVEKYPNPSPAATSTAAAAKTPALAYGCAAALAYLHAHAEPHFTIECPAAAYNARGGPAQAMTCVSHPPQCPANTGVIAISDPCPTAYMNEAANSWIALGLRPGAMDPYGPSC